MDCKDCKHFYDCDNMGYYGQCELIQEKEENMSKYIIREQMEPELPDWLEDSYDDVFVVTSDHGRSYSLINWEDYKEIKEECYNAISELEDGYTLQDIAENYRLQYSPENEETLKGLGDMVHDDERIARYMEIKTGQRYSTRTVKGYCQSDWAIAIYPADIYKERDIDILGDYCFGCFKEFSITQEDEEVFGYIVTDSELSHDFSDQAYKETVCAMEGIDPKDAILEMIEDVKTIRQPVYRTA